MSRSERAKCCWCPSVCALCVRFVFPRRNTTSTPSATSFVGNDTDLLLVYCLGCARVRDGQQTEAQRMIDAIAAVVRIRCERTERRSWFQLRVIEQSVCTSIDLIRFDNFCQMSFRGFRPKSEMRALNHEIAFNRFNGDSERESQNGKKYKETNQSRSAEQMQYWLRCGFLFD